MNKEILKRCVAELKKEAPNLQYVIGSLETLIDLNSSSSALPEITIPGRGGVNLDTNITSADEHKTTDETPDFLKTGRIGRITS